MNLGSIMSIHRKEDWKRPDVSPRSKRSIGAKSQCFGVLEESTPIETLSDDETFNNEYDYLILDKLDSNLREIRPST